jgi:SAM-dependent methyltransferase
MLPRSVLDIGPGAGKYGKMIQGLRSRGVDIPHLAAIEIDASYVEQFELNGIYDVVQVGDATSLPDIGPDACWDLVILGDVLEHFRKSRGVDLIDYLYYRTKYIVLLIPLDYVQGAWEGHHAEAHISTWRPEDFARYKATCVKSDAGSGCEIMMVLINGLQANVQKDFLFANYASPVLECVAAE